MRKALLLLCLGTLWTPPAAAMTLEEVQGLLRAGVDEETIRAQIRSEGTTFQLEAADILALHEAGASSKLLQFLIDRRNPGEGPGKGLRDAGTGEGEPPVPPGGRRFFVQARQDGGLVYVFTNLDREGNRLPENGTEPAFSRIASRDEARGPSAPAEAPPERPGCPFPPGPSTQVIVVQPPAPPVPPPAPLFAGYPVFFTGGIAGPFRYPEHLPFLGYGIDNGFPRFFTGLGMQARTDGREGDD